ncbi:two-component system regulatory protein YycI [Bacillus sp. 165]|uniref:two-component system regulatory protein YycI n=1 Tax=Bacillus sp. 165 TaxID=1529117 RepID=UPI001ADCC2F0|nr:two-component system regulatory protein YycI [Bacillus sp. 165]MBO9131342.1 two-component system regulatory protein YycI [Bacillus sp. 165]
MDWSKIKNIFIITFFIFDIFLAFQVIQKQNRNELDLMIETSVEDQLAADDIKYVNLPKEPKKEVYITGKNKEFNNSELAALKNQSALIINFTTLQSKLKNAVQLQGHNKGAFFEEFLRTYVFEGVKYKYWKTDERTRTVYFFQQYNGKNIFVSPLILKLNEKDEIVSYKQTVLRDIEKMGGDNEKQEIITAIKALETLYLKNELKPGSKVTKVELGYYTVVPLSSGVQVMAPTWHFEVNDKEDYFVNAVEGQIIKEQNIQWSEVK